MKLTFLGADHEVTGSCTLVETMGHRFLVDCGMEQGADVYENAPLPLAPGDVDALLLTHAHIDHTGRVPVLYTQGYRGPIYCTEATMSLCSIMLRDSAHIQEFEAEWKNRKGEREGRSPVQPLYTVQDVVNVMKQFKGYPYEQSFQLFDNVRVTFTDCGHLLGSSYITLEITEDGETVKLVFSGDIGNSDQPIIKDPVPLKEADYLVMESTYGNRLHERRDDYITGLTKVLQETFDRGGNVVIPSFAVGRTQEMLYFLRTIKELDLVKNHPDFEVYMDSPLAQESTRIFAASYADCYDEEAMELVERGINPLTFPGLKIATTSDESRAINSSKTPKVILSASGMCEAGRIRHHLKHNLWRPESTILFVGYQSVGTLGRALVEGATEVKLFGEAITVRAQIRQLTGLSGHADMNGLDAWLAGAKVKPAYIFVNHGEDLVCESYAQRLRDHGYQAVAPYNGAEYQLTAQGVECLYQGNTVKKEQKHPVLRQNPVYQRLVDMGKRLMTVITHNEGGSNKDLARFADQIAALCDKWDR